MARRFFNPESGVWKPLGFFGDLVILSLLWCLCSVPLVTLGPATAALYDTVVHSMRRKEAPPFYRFFDTFRRELKEGVLLTLLLAGVALGLGLLAYGFFRLFPAIGERGAIVSLAELLLIFLYLAVASWVFPTLSRFTMGVGALCSACVRLAPGYAPRRSLPQRARSRNPFRTGPQEIRSPLHIRIRAILNSRVSPSFHSGPPSRASGIVISAVQRFS